MSEVSRKQCLNGSLFVCALLLRNTFVHFFYTSPFRIALFHTNSIHSFNAVLCLCCTFFHVPFFSCCTSLSCCTIFRLHFFLATLFSSCIYIIIHFLCCFLCTLHTSHVASFPCLTVFMLRFFQFALFHDALIYSLSLVSFF